ncbi:MAG: hypothetical protein R3Y35_04105 [Clostridia bacterium]
MEEIKSVLFRACVAMIISEIIYYITPKEKLTDCVYALVYTLVIVGSVLSISFSDYEFVFEETNPYSDEIDEFIYEYYLIETENELKSIIIEALDVLHIETEEITTIIDVSDDTVTVVSINVMLSYKSDIDNAIAILDEVFNGQIPLEVSGEI